ncbi:MAG: phosphoribosylamine--glycine ligase [Patescibacteria group bacterium]|nr:phosphoribosylamine--glycine ligase [Patescibacteria group bacterium]MDD5294590.1 phosphoribosylamine--glycine ligase [Patescibacteria group bacterium]MDD5554094.1 phosphoribosylamine--glycine ligase [Patescibacteria group bacterium]
MKVLVIGSGGRESALVRKIAKSDLVDRLFCAPGNAGIGTMARNIAIAVDDIEGQARFAQEQKVDLTIVGPEWPLVNGIVNKFMTMGLPIFGPSRQAARLEGSKIFAKRIMAKAGVPTADFEVFTDADMAASRISRCLENFGLPVVIKVDGLAAGKGAMVCFTKEGVETALGRIKENEFGSAGNEFLIEKFLRGREISFIVLVDKNGHILPLATSQDHKSLYDHDSGWTPNPNTGGMGAYSPAPFVTTEMEQRIMERIIERTVAAMAERGTPFTGVLYAGLMIDENGNPYVLEFNVRFGDPETQPILARMKSDLVAIIMAALEGNLDKVRIEWDTRPAVSIVIASGGYPDSNYQKGFIISGLKEAAETGAIIDHAGTALDRQGRVITAGGRVLGVTALGDNFRQAQANAYRAVEKISWTGCYSRRDIAWQALEK